MAISNKPRASNPEPSKGGAFDFLVPSVACAWLHSQGTEWSLDSGKKGMNVFNPKGSYPQNLHENFFFTSLTLDVVYK